MTTATTTRTAILTGDTYAIRGTLKNDDWSYDAASKSWSRPFATLTPAEVFARLRVLMGGRSCGRLSCRIVEA